MFAPPGYLVIHRVEHLFRNRLLETMPDPVEPDLYSGDSNFTTYERTLKLLVERRAEARNRAVAGFLRSCKSLSVCKLNGEVFRISPNVMTFEMSLKRSTPKGFLFVDRQTWTVSLQRAENWVAINTRERDQLVVELRWLQKTNNLRNADVIRDTLDILTLRLQRLPPLIRHFQPFDGAALAIAESDFPSADVLDQFLTKDAIPEYVGGDAEEELVRTTIGRPRKQEMALASYQKLYPDGHGHMTWKAVSQAITRDVKSMVSVTTLQRALGLRDAEIQGEQKKKTRRTRRGGVRARAVRGANVSRQKQD